jgi:hypothetical protein
VSLLEQVDGGVEPDDAELRDIERRLLAAFSPPVPASVVHACFVNAVARFDGARIRTYVPMLVERIARADLGRLTAQPEGNA